MTIPSSSPARISYNCDGVSKVFPVQIQAYQAADLTVILTAPASAGGGEAVLTLNSDYSLTPSGSLQPTAWTLTTLPIVAYATGYTLQVFANPVQQQQTQYVQGQAFPSLAMQTNLDRLTQMVQRLQDQVNRSIRAPDGDVNPQMLLPVTPNRLSQALMMDANGNITLGVPNSQNITLGLLAPFLNLTQTAAEAIAGVVPVNLAYSATGPIDVRRYGYSADNLTTSAANNRAALNQAIAVATATVNGASGATVQLPTGIAYIDQVIILPNRVRIKGQNCSGSLIKATPGFTTPTPAWSAVTAYVIGNLVANGGQTYSCVAPNTNQAPPNATYWALWPQVMFWANNGVTSMFDSIIEDIFIDCSSVGGLGGILTDAWQENCGMRNVGLMNFTTVGLRFRNVNAGGQSTCEIKQCQFFPPNLPGVSAGIQVDQISSVGAFLVHMRDSVIAGNAANPCARGINMVNDSLNIDNCHFEGCVDAIYQAGVGSLTAKHITGLAGMTNLVHIDPAFAGRVNLMGCFRNGATNFLTNGATGEVYTSPDISDYVYPEVVAPNSAKAFCLFNGTTVGTNPPTAGYNVQSVQRNSVGNYSVRLTRPLTSANCVPVASQNTGPSGTVLTQLVSAGRVDVLTFTGGVATDSGEVKLVVFGQS